MSFLQCLSATKLLSYNLISFDGISYKSENTPEYKLRGKQEPCVLTSLSPYRKRGVRESFSTARHLSVLVLGAHSLKERGKRERKKKKHRVFEVSEKLEIQVTTINSETLHKINYSFASEAGM